MFNQNISINKTLVNAVAKEMGIKYSSSSDHKKARKEVREMYIEYPQYEATITEILSVYGLNVDELDTNSFSITLIDSDNLEHYDLIVAVPIWNKKQKACFSSATRWRTIKRVGNCIVFRKRVTGLVKKIVKKLGYSDYDYEAA